MVKERSPSHLFYVWLKRQLLVKDNTLVSDSGAGGQGSVIHMNYIVYNDSYMCLRPKLLQICRFKNKRLRDIYFLKYLKHVWGLDKWWVSSGCINKCSCVLTALQWEWLDCFPTILSERSMYRGISVGPSTERCGTPWLTLSYFDDSSLTWTELYLSCK